MKKTINALALLVCACLLAGCMGQIQQELPPDIVPLPGPEETYAEDFAEHARYSLRDNPYNTQTTHIGEHILAAEAGALYQISLTSEAVRTIVDNDTLGYRLGGAGFVAAIDSNIYFIASKNMQDVLDQKADTLECGIFRTDENGQNAAEVAAVYQTVHTLHAFDGYLVAYVEAHGAPLERAAQYKIFLPDSDAAQLEAVPVAALPDAWFDDFEAYAYPYHNEQELFARMGYSAEGGHGASGLRANDACYVLEGSTLYRLPIDDGEAVEIPLTASAREALTGKTASREGVLVNYDEEWLYIKSEFSIYRLRKDGSEAELCVKGGVGGSWAIDVCSGLIIYSGTNGQLYMYNTATSENTRLNPEAEGERVEVECVDNYSQFIVCPVLEADRQRLGSELVINPSGLEIVDTEGNAVYFTDIAPGARLTVDYTSYYEATAEGGFATLHAYKITVHTI